MLDIDALEIRWNPQAKTFFVGFGNVRFAVSKTAAHLLANGLLEAIRVAPGPQEGRDLMEKGEV